MEGEFKEEGSCVLTTLYLLLSVDWHWLWNDELRIACKEAVLTAGIEGNHEIPREPSRSLGLELNAVPSRCEALVHCTSAFVNTSRYRAMLAWLGGTTKIRITYSPSQVRTWIFYFPVSDPNREYWLPRNYKYGDNISGIKRFFFLFYSRPFSSASSSSCSPLLQNFFFSLSAPCTIFFSYSGFLFFFHFSLSNLWNILVQNCLQNLQRRERPTNSCSTECKLLVVTVWRERTLCGGSETRNCMILKISESALTADLPMCCTQ